MTKRRRTLWIGAALGVTAVALAALGALRAPATTAASRGAEVAERMGCFACHGPGGRGGVPNPGAGGDIPGWDSDSAEMYLENAAEIREWILDGEPERLRRAARESRDDDPALVRMPAYRGYFDDAELGDLVAYFQAVSGYETMPEQVSAGRRAAERLGCFGCHGPGGRTGANNPRGFKGILPAWEGADFRELVRDDAELRGWILDGGIPRLRDDVVARGFLERQPIHMPAYRSVLAPGELDAIVTYIRWLDREATPPRP